MLCLLPLAHLDSLQADLHRTPSLALNSRAVRPALIQHKLDLVNSATQFALQVGVRYQ